MTVTQSTSQTGYRGATMPASKDSSAVRGVADHLITALRAGEGWAAQPANRVTSLAALAEAAPDLLSVSLGRAIAVTARRSRTHLISSMTAEITDEIIRHPDTGRVVSVIGALGEYIYEQSKQTEGKHNE